MKCHIGIAKEVLEEVMPILEEMTEMSEAAIRNALEPDVYEMRIKDLASDEGKAISKAISKVLDMLGDLRDDVHAKWDEEAQSTYAKTPEEDRAAVAQRAEADRPLQFSPEQQQKATQDINDAKEAAVPESTPAKPKPQAEQPEPQASAPEPEQPQVAADDTGATDLFGEPVSAPAMQLGETVEVILPAQIDGRNLSGHQATYTLTSLNLDPGKFQHRIDGNVSTGEVGTLSDIETYDPGQGGRFFFYRQANGKVYVLDGHQRYGLAKAHMERTGEEPVLSGMELREEDGWTENMAKTYASILNLNKADQRAQAPFEFVILMELTEADPDARQIYDSMESTMSDKLDQRNYGKTIYKLATPAIRDAILHGGISPPLRQTFPAGKIAEVLKAAQEAMLSSGVVFSENVKTTLQQLVIDIINKTDNMDELRYMAKQHAHTVGAELQAGPRETADLFAETGNLFGDNEIKNIILDLKIELGGKIYRKIKGTLTVLRNINKNRDTLSDIADADAAVEMRASLKEAHDRFEFQARQLDSVETMILEHFARQVNDGEMTGDDVAVLITNWYRYAFDANGQYDPILLQKAFEDDFNQAPPKTQKEAVARRAELRKQGYEFKGKQKKDSDEPEPKPEDEPDKPEPESPAPAAQAADEPPKPDEPAEQATTEAQVIPGADDYEQTVTQVNDGITMLTLTPKRSEAPKATSAEVTSDPETGITSTMIEKYERLKAEPGPDFQGTVWDVESKLARTIDLPTTRRVPKIEKGMAQKFPDGKRVITQLHEVEFPVDIGVVANIVKRKGQKEKGYMLQIIKDGEKPIKMLGDSVEELESGGLQQYWMETEQGKKQLAEALEKVKQRLKGGDQEAAPEQPATTAADSPQTKGVSNEIMDIPDPAKVKGKWKVKIGKPYNSMGDRQVEIVAPEGIEFKDELAFGVRDDRFGEQADEGIAGYVQLTYIEMKGQATRKINELLKKSFRGGEEFANLNDLKKHLKQGLETLTDSMLNEGMPKGKSIVIDRKVFELDEYDELGVKVAATVMDGNYELVIKVPEGIKSNITAKLDHRITRIEGSEYYGVTMEKDFEPATQKIYFQSHKDASEYAKRYVENEILVAMNARSYAKPEFAGLRMLARDIIEERFKGTHDGLISMPGIGDWAELLHGDGKWIMNIYDEKGRDITVIAGGESVEFGLDFKTKEEALAYARQHWIRQGGRDRSMPVPEMMTAGLSRAPEMVVMHGEIGFKGYHGIHGTYEQTGENVWKITMKRGGLNEEGAGTKEVLWEREFTGTHEELKHEAYDWWRENWKDLMAEPTRSTESIDAEVAKILGDERNFDDLGELSERGQKELREAQAKKSAKKDSDDLNACAKKNN